MQALCNQTLSQIVTDNYRTATVLEKYHLDFCCRGKRTLEQACAEKEIPLEEVLPALETLNTSGNTCQASIAFEKLSLSNLVDYILYTHHDYVKKEIPRIINYLQKIIMKHGERFPEMRLVLEVFTELKVELQEHLIKEELLLFPRIKEIEKAHAEMLSEKLNISYLLSPISIMEHEHENAGDMLEEIRSLTNNYTIPADTCNTFKICIASLQAFEADLHHHVHLENNILFPKAIGLLRQPVKINLNHSEN